MSLTARVDVRGRVRSMLVRGGRTTTSLQLLALRSCLSYLELGRWLADLPPADRPRSVSSDLEVFDVARGLIRAGRFLYLEFGVFEGRTIRWWAEHLDHEQARFVGFDSFEGLPEAWRGLDSGFFATGAPPDIADERVSFQAGWFEDTVPSFELPPHDQLMINIDSDLYSSARTILRHLGRHLTEGTLLYFDEFSDRDHEMRIYFEFVETSGAQLRPLAMARNGTNMLFEVTRPPSPEGLAAFDAR